MVAGAPESAASMHGPNPASYWRSSSWADSAPVKATLETCPSSIRVTDTSAAPVIVCFASSATRPRTSDSCCSPSMILLSSAKGPPGLTEHDVAQLDKGDPRVQRWVGPAGVEGGHGGIPLSGRTAGRASRQSWKRRRRPLTSEEPGREPADALLHAHRQPVVGNGANSPHAWDRLIEDDATRRSPALGGPRRPRPRPQQPVHGGRNRGDS